MKNKQERHAVVVGLNLNTLGVARALGRNGVNVTVVGDGSSAPEARSRYMGNVWVCENQIESLVETLLARRADLPDEPPVLLPVTDSSVTIVSENLPLLRQHYRIGMPAPDLVRSLLDKRSIAQLAEEHNLPSPQTFFIDAADQIESIAHEMTYPCIMKPQIKSPTYSDAGGKKAYVLDDSESLLATYDTFCEVEPRVIVQEYVPGEDGDVYFCLQYYDRQSRPLVSFCGRKIRQWPPHCGGTASCEPVDLPELTELSTTFFQKMNFQGLCSLEFKRDARDGSFKAIEPTVCRTDWQSAVADMNGVPIPFVAYCDLAGLPQPKLRAKRRRIKWVYLASDRLSADYYRRERQLGLIGWLLSIRPPVRGAYWALDDPKPLSSILMGKLANRIKKLVRMVSPARRGRVE